VTDRPLLDGQAVRRVLIGLAVLFYAIFIARSAFVVDGGVGFTLFDDGMISMRYARNLAEGHGLVWNAGQEAVEGFTNPLWTLWMAAVHLTGVSDLHAPLLVMLTGAALLLAGAVLSARLADQVFQAPDVGAVAFLFVGFNYALVFWTLRGMEAGLLALLVTVALRLTLALERRADAATLLGLCGTLILAELTRRDAAVIHVVIMAYAGWRLDGRHRRVTLAALAIALVIALGSQTLLSAWYYGDPLPNTATLKLGGVSLIERLRRGIPALTVSAVRSLVPLVLAAALMVPRALRDHALRGPIALLAGSVAAQCTYSAYVGGDAWEYMGYPNRYISVVVPPLSILAAAGVLELAAASRRVRYRFAAVLLAAVGARVVLEAGLVKANRGVPRGAAFVEAHLSEIAAGGLALASVAVLMSAGLWWRASHRDGAVAPGASRRLIVALACAVFIVSNGPALAGWTFFNASALTQDNQWARAGLAVGRITAPDTVLAVTSAGNFPYFARRPALDILGKSDRVIARSAPVNVFVPGHNKWNLGHTVRDGQPDLVCGLPRAPGESRYLLELGYEAWPGTCFARGGSARLNHDALHDAFVALYPDVPPHPEAAIR
jgi:hypothetical protein